MSEAQRSETRKVSTQDASQWSIEIHAQSGLCEATRLYSISWINGTSCISSVL